MAGASAEEGIKSRSTGVHKIKRDREREINYLSSNVKQRRQMSRGEDELQITGMPLCRYYVTESGMKQRGDEWKSRAQKEVLLLVSTWFTGLPV